MEKRERREGRGISAWKMLPHGLFYCILTSVLQCFTFILPCKTAVSADWSVQEWA